MKHFAVISVALLLGSCATTESKKSHAQLYAENLVTVPEGANWKLIGEWDLPGSEGFLNFTRSIVLFNGKYVEVNSGRVVTGCCYWPQGVRLKHLAEDAFLNPVSGATYLIDPSGSLIISEKNGTVTTASKTATEYSLSRQWRRTKE